MNKTLNTLFGALLLTGSVSAFAASSVDLTVTGMITPSACEPTLSSGGLVDYGKISAKDLNADRVTYLPTQTVQLSLTCDAPTSVALEAKDNRAGSSWNSLETYGLGMINTTEKLGAMELKLSSATADGVVVSTIGSVDQGNTWVKETGFFTDNILAVAVPGTLTPIMVQQLNADLKIHPEIAPSNQLTLTNEVAIDGSVTLSVVYF
jgi:type 1 fimbria pilin